jgi:hypothetical protein
MSSFSVADPALLSGRVAAGIVTSHGVLTKIVAHGRLAGVFNAGVGTYQYVFHINTPFEERAAMDKSMNCAVNSINCVHAIDLALLTLLMGGIISAYHQARWRKYPFTSPTTRKVT